MNHTVTVRLAHTDAAGRLFFANMFVLAHEAWEACLDQLGYGIRDMLSGGEYLTPVVHAESDYSAPVTLGAALTIATTCIAIGRTSFTIGFEACLEDGTPAARLKQTHVAIDTATGAPIPVPAALQELLKKL